MLRLFFFVVTYLTDYRAAAELVHGGFALGMVNAGLVGLAGVYVALRGSRGSIGRGRSGTLLVK